MSYLQCPQCRLTVPASAYYLRGDQCPRCLAQMQKQATFRREPVAADAAWSPVVHGSATPPADPSPKPAA